MAVPDLKQIRGPALQLFADGKTRRIRDVFKELAPRFNLTDEDLAQILPSGKQSMWHNRVNWSCFDLSQAGLLHRPQKGVYVITDEGRKLAGNLPPLLTRTYLIEHYPQFAEWIRRSSGASKPEVETEKSVRAEQQTPDELMASEFRKLQEQLKAELLTIIKQMDPFRFEYLVIDLLVAMGYGGSREEAATVTQKSNDEGIDGLINEDRLGLDRIYVQAKRWQNTVGRPEIQSFVGALAGKHAQKGIFITTSDFSSSAIEFARGIPQRVTLINGQRLADLMIEHNVGVARAYAYEIKRIDSDYFEGS